MKKRILSIILVIIMILGLYSAPVLAASGGSFDDTWNWANPLPQGNDLNSVTSGGGMYVAVGGSGAVMTSTNGVTWARANSDFYDDYYAVAYGNGLFVAGGDSGTVGRSADGTNWTYDSTYEYDSVADKYYGTTGDILGMTYGAGLFVAVGNGFIITSADGENWSSEDDITVSGVLNDVTYGNGYFVAVGDSGKIWYSNDGITWNADTSGVGNNLTAVTYGDGKYIAVGQGGTILDAAALGTIARGGAPWAKGDTIYYGGLAVTLYSVAYGNGHYIITSGKMYLTSTEGINWTMVVDEANLVSLNSVVYGNEGFVSVGTYGMIIAIDSGSTDWTERSSGSKNSLSGMTYNNNLFVAVGTDKIMTSVNGVDWASQATPTVSGIVTVILESVAGNGSGGYAAVGSGYDADDIEYGTLAYSTNGTSWNMATTLGENSALKGVAYGLNSDFIGMYVAVGSSFGGITTGVIYISEDGNTWTQVDTGTIGRLTAVTYGNGMFTAVGESDTIMTSPDGSTWTTQTHISAISYTGIAYGSGLFMAVGGTGKITASTNGAIWTDVDTFGSNFEGITYGDEYFVAAGQNGMIAKIPVPGGIIGTTLQTGQYTTPNRLNAAAYGNGVYAVAGNNGTILYSGTPAGSTYALTISAGAGGSIVTGSGGNYASGAAIAIEATPSSGYTFSGWTASNGGTFTSAGSASTTFTMPAAATTVTANFTANGGSGGGTGGGGPDPSGSKDTDYGKITTNGGNVTATINYDKLDLGKRGAAVVITVTDKNATNITFQQTVADLKKIADNESILQLETPFGIYKLPAREIDFESISKSYPNIDYKDIIVSVKFAKTDRSNAKLGSAGLVGQPVDFLVVLSAKGTDIELDEFTQYVERDLPVPDGKTFTTGVVIEPDGSLRYVPSKMTTINGQTYAVIYSRTNSVYCLIKNTASFSDMTNHWAKDTVNDMASRLIINGVGDGSFAPNKKITRAEFTAIVVRALGLKASGSAAFADVGTNKWYYGATAAAYRYGIVQGNGEKFRPNDSITREEAMVMISRAMKVAGMDSSISDESVSLVLAGFSDGGKISDWAKTSTAVVVQSGVAAGSNGKLRPLDHINRAETAAMVERLLEKAGLI